MRPALAGPRAGTPAQPPAPLYSAPAVPSRWVRSLSAARQAPSSPRRRTAPGPRPNPFRRESQRLAAEGVGPRPFPQRLVTTGTVVSTDYAKAYDMVQHDPLFAIAKRIGGDGYSQWLRTMYTGHQRFIVANGVISPPVKLLSGVPQGCCHACQAFLIFIEGLAHRIRGNVAIRGLEMPDGSVLLDVRYADDCQYVVHADTLETLLDVIDGWADEVGMKLNETKTEAAWWGRRRDDTTPWHPSQYGGQSAARGGKPAGQEFCASEHRMVWLPPGAPIHVLGMDIGYTMATGENASLTSKQGSR
eukprot:COSAG06_NODE_926_length_11497_cov_60.540216_6_plen_303_part_00